MNEHDSSHTTTPQVEVPQKKRLSGRTLFWICATVIGLLLFSIAIMDELTSFARNVLNILSPIIIGGVIAYLCNPILRFYEQWLFAHLRRGGLRHSLSLILTILTAFAIIGGVFFMIIPQLADSITDLLNNYESHIDNLLVSLQSVINTITADLHVDIDISSMDKMEALLTNVFGSTENFLAQLQDKLQSSSSGNLFGNIWSGLLDVFNAFKNLFIGMFIAFYLLASKEKRSAQIRKFRRAMFSDKTNERIREVTSLVDDTFGGFIFGKIMDSLVIGVLTFLLLTIFEISPYNMLIAAFVGVTNVIPVFGPFIGAIPSFIIVLISNPSKAFLFLVLIFIIQQIDGNIIGPKILGDNTGVSSLCVIIAIVVCGSLWGVAGMIVGVPIFAVIIELVKRYLEARLRKKGEPTDTANYYNTHALANAEQELHYEHAGLLYKYRHSRLRFGMRRAKRFLFNHLGRHHSSSKKSKSTKKNSDTPTDSTPTE